MWTPETHPESKLTSWYAYHGRARIAETTHKPRRDRFVLLHKDYGRWLEIKAFSKLADAKKWGIENPPTGTSEGEDPYNVIRQKALLGIKPTNKELNQISQKQLRAKAMNETKKRNQLEKRRIIAEARKEKQFQIQSLRQQIALLRENLRGERKRIVAEARQNRIDIRNRFAQRRVALREEERNLLRQINQLAKDKILTIRERREKISEIRQQIRRIRSINVEKEQKTIDLINASLHPLLHYMETKTGKEPHHEKVIAAAIAKPEMVLEAAQHPAHVQLKELEAEHKQHTKKTRAARIPKERSTHKLKGAGHYAGRTPDPELSEMPNMVPEAGLIEAGQQQRKEAFKKFGRTKLWKKIKDIKDPAWWYVAGQQSFLADIKWMYDHQKAAISMGHQSYNKNTPTGLYESRPMYSGNYDTDAPPEVIAAADANRAELYQLVYEHRDIHGDPHNEHRALLSHMNREKSPYFWAANIPRNYAKFGRICSDPKQRARLIADVKSYYQTI